MKKLTNQRLAILVDAENIEIEASMIALVSGGVDYEPLIWHLRSKGCKVEVWSWPWATADSLKRAADEFRPLDERFLLHRPMEMPLRHVRWPDWRSQRSKASNE